MTAAEQGALLTVLGSGDLEQVHQGLALLAALDLSDDEREALLLEAMCRAGFTSESAAMVLYEEVRPLLAASAEKRKALPPIGEATP